MNDDKLLNAHIGMLTGIVMYFGSLLLVDICKPQFMISIYTPLFVMPYLGLLIMIVALCYMVACIYRTKAMDPSKSHP